MGVFTFNNETTSKIPPAKLFKALVLDADNLIPKVLPQAIQSSQIVQGDGGVGTIKNITFGQVSPYKNVTHRVEEVDEQNWRYSYSAIEGDALSEKNEKITHQTQLVASEEDGGSVIKSSSTYFTKDDSVITEQDVNFSKDKASGLLKAVEAYLLANPQAYN